MSLNLKEKQNNLKQKLDLRILTRQAKRWLLTNTRTKVWIFIFTIVLWLFVILNNRYSYSFSAKLEVRNIDPTKTLMEKIPGRIQASFSGRGIDLFYLVFSRQKSFRFFIDCQSIKKYYDFPLNEYFENNPDKVIIPRGANVRLDHVIWPETLHVVLDDLQTIKVPVKPIVDFKMAPGYILVDSLQVIPDSVTISGPHSIVQNIREIPTEKLSQTAINRSIDRAIALDFSSKNNIQIDTKTVRCQQKVDQLSERELHNISVIVTNLKPNQTVEVIPSTATITVSGGLEKLKTIQPGDIKLILDMVKDWQPDQSYYKPAVELPDGILSWRNLTPETFEIRVIRERQP